MGGGGGQCTRWQSGLNRGESAAVGAFREHCCWVFTLKTTSQSCIRAPRLRNQSYKGWGRPPSGLPAQQSLSPLLAGPTRHPRLGPLPFPGILLTPVRQSQVRAACASPPAAHPEQAAPTLACAAEPQGRGPTGPATASGSPRLQEGLCPSLCPSCDIVVASPGRAHSLLRLPTGSPSSHGRGHLGVQYLLLRINFLFMFFLSA
ncbi:hypothetical protein HJG60_012088 [Phyllostomus discolor]|uniref:Uncharacterized protein n=1 Tax=Phyllostomus discolor TaxID=89673 RepID=A0A833ZQ57_9CHIR|nr:hypothetical protein HJG60_012088 [Phyllostomus discolor]